MDEDDDRDARGMSDELGETLQPPFESVLADGAVVRRSLAVSGVEWSYLQAGDGDVAVLLLHGTFWSRVWLRVLPRLGERVCAIAPDFPGFGCSGGRLDTDRASVPALAEQAQRFAASLGVGRWVGVAGHDIGGAVAQHLAVHAADRFERLALVNSVLYDSWPVPAVARFQDPEVAERFTVDDMLEARAESLSKATAAKLDRETREQYLAPWRDEARVRSWIAMAAAADARHTLDLVEPLRRRGGPTLLVWGEDDAFQPVDHARRFQAEVPGTELVVLPGARHIPMEDDTAATADALARFFRP